jgi:hypothetical protein
MVVTQLTGIPLIERFDGKGLYPLYLARWFPRKRNLGFLARALAKGVLLVGAPKAHLVEADHRALDGIRRRLEAAWETPGEVTEIETREHVRTCIFACHRMEEMARLVVWADRVLKRHTPQGVFADSVLNPLVNIFFELAKRKGIATLGTWHGPEQFDVKMFVYGSDPRVPAPLDACLTWGKSHEDWLVNTSGTSTPIRTGNVIASQYREERTTTASSDGLVGGRKGKRALVLQNTCPWYDAGVPLTNEYVLFVETIRMLRDLGYTDIRFKLHPGIPVMAQYQEIARYFSLHCDIFQDGEFKDFVAWADFVIGPVHSGAMLEVLASGKPYYPILLPHSTLNRKYVAAGQTFPDMESLRQALAAGKTPDHDAYLQNYTSLEDIPDPAARTWEVVKEKLNPVESKVEVEAWSLPQHPRG